MKEKASHFWIVRIIIEIGTYHYLIAKLIMALLKEDGSLDVERINSLPREEKHREICKFTREQMEEFLSKLQISESRYPMKIVEIDYKMEDMLVRGCCTIDDIHDILTK